MNDYEPHEEWVKSFSKHLKIKAFEQFSLLLCDINSPNCDPEQKELLHDILFKDSRSVDTWQQYINVCVHLFPDKKLQLQRLVSKALETIDEKRNKDDDKFIQIHLQAASMKR